MQQVTAAPGTKKDHTQHVAATIAEERDMKFSLITLMLPCRMCVSQRVAEPFVVHRIRSAAPPLPEAEVGGWTVWLIVIIYFLEAALISATVLREKEKRTRWREKFNLKTNPDFLIINTCIKPHSPEPWDVGRKAKQDKETSQQWFWIGEKVCL